MFIILIQMSLFQTPPLLVLYHYPVLITLEYLYIIEKYMKLFYLCFYGPNPCSMKFVILHQCIHCA